MAIGTRSYANPYLSNQGRLPQGIKWLIIINTAVWLVCFFSRDIASFLLEYFALTPVRVMHGWVWQPVTYMFLHDPGSVFHILFNMLALWMFGAELERIWGTRYFLKFYFVTGVGAGLLTVLVSLLPFVFTRQLFGAAIIGASGAIYGLLLAYGMYFPDRPIYIFGVFPIPAKTLVMILGAIALYASLSQAGGTANATHLGGLLVGYLYLKSGRAHPLAELKYRYLKWKINRVRKKFDVYSGGRADDFDRRVH